MSWTAVNPVSIGEPTKKSHYDTLWDNVAMLADFASLQTGKEQGDIIYYDGANYVRLPHSTAGYVLLCGGHGANPAWGAFAASIIKQSNLATSIAQVGGHAVGGVDTNYTLPGGEYGFYPKVLDYNPGHGTITSHIAQTYTSGGIFTANIHLQCLEEAVDTGAYAQQRYVTASGKEHWIFVIIQQSTGKIIHGYSAPDHPCSGNGDNPLLVPHPFPDYWGKPLPEGLEIVLLDLEDTMKVKENGLIKITDEIKIETKKEESFKPRDLNGKQDLIAKDASYALRKMRVI